MNSIRRRLLWLLLPAMTALMIGGGLLDYWIASATTRDAYDRSLASMALAAGAYLRESNGTLQYTPSLRVSAFLAPSARSSSMMWFRVADAHGRTIAGSEDLPGPPMLKDASETVFTDAHYHGIAIRVATLTVPTSTGLALISVAESRERRSGTQRVMLYGKLLIDFAEFDAALLLVWAAVSFGLRPLRALRQQAEAFDPRELRRFDERPVPDELRPLILAFNHLLELLHDAATAQRRFVADAAHQMRTPVAAIQAHLELLLRDPRATPVTSELGSVERGIKSLAHSANQLLALARAEPTSTDRADFQRVSLKSLVEEMVERYIERADAARIDLGADVHIAEVSGNVWMLEDLLTNLLDNALKYGGAGCQVTVRCGVQGGQAYLEVEDTGPGIPEEERQRVRERFYRRAGASGVGCGLGLPIVDEIARAHGAIFTIGSGDAGRGCRMRVSFREPAVARRV